MTTTNTNEHYPADSAACEDPDNNESLSIRAPEIGDPVFMHIGETFITRELVRLKQVSNEVAELVSSNTVFTNKARWQGNMEDWYFPLLVLQIYNRVFRKFERTWSGIHHSSGRVHGLPCLSYFFPEEQHVDPNHLLASSGGLVLLVKTLASVGSSWSPLVVSNPVTQEWRALPEPDCRNIWPQYLAFLIVDERANTYKVILILTRSLFVVYKSTSKTWSFWNLPQPIPSSIFKLESPVYGGHYVMSSCCRTLGVAVNGRLHFAELAYGGDTEPSEEVASGVNMLSLGGVRVHEVDDDDAGVWKPAVEYPLRNYMPSDLHREYEEYGFRKSSYMITIVECMGGMYAIIPAAMDVQEIGEEIRLTYDLSSAQVRCVDVGILPLRFYILRLQGSSGRVFGQLLIHDASRVLDRENAPPPNRSTQAFYESLYFYMFKNSKMTTSRWYHCASRGSVIWVSVGDYVVQYDVVSGRSTTHILGAMLASAGEHSLASALSEASYRSVFRPHLTFEPSLYTKP